MTSYDRLDHEQRLVFDALAAAPNKDEAAKALGISRATLYRRLQEAELREALQDARAEALGDATDSLQRLANEAALCLAFVMNSKDAPYSSRVAAASKLLDLAYRSFELESIAAEIDALKRELL